MSDVPSNLIPTRITQLPVAPVADENSLMMIVYQGNNYQIRVGDLLSVAGVPTSRAVLAGTGLTGGGQLSSNVTLSIAPGGVGTTQLASTGVTPGSYGSASNIPVFTVDAKGRVTAAGSVPVVVSGYVPTTRQVIAGTGLTGGGALNANVTLDANLSDATPLPTDGLGTAGVSTSISRSDHQHPSVNLQNPSEVDGLLPLNRGGTARSLVMDEGAVIWSGADGLYVGPIGAVGQALLSGGTGEYTWGDVVYSVNGYINTVVLTYSDVGAPATDGTDAYGTWNIDISGNAATATNADHADAATQVDNAVTFSNTGGAAPGTTFDGAVARTVDYSTLGAPKADGTGASGLWSIDITGNAATATLAASTTSVAGGAANKLVYQSNVSTTAFVNAPTITDTFLKWDGASFIWSALPGAGTVTSVGLALPAEFTISNSPVTSSGTLTGAWANATANYVFAGPTTGSPGTPSLRALVNADFPASGVTPDTYGSTTEIPVITVDDKGLITSVTLANIVGGLSYQGSWDADTNTPALASGVGTNGFYYIVSVAGTTNLDGITDWEIGDWAIFNGVAWQKIDQTNLVASVNGQTGVVVLDYADVGAPATDGTDATGTWDIDITGNADTATTAGSVTNSATFNNSGTGDASPQTFNGSAAITVSYNTLGAANSGANTNITSIDSITGGISTPDFIKFDTTLLAAPTTVEGGLYYSNDDNANTLELVGHNGIIFKLNEEQYYRIKASSNITKGQVVMFTGTVGASGGLIAAPATGLTADQSNYILGVAAETITTGNWGYATFFGEIRGLNTTGGAESWVDGTILYYNPAVTGGLTKNKPTVPNAIAVVAAVVYAHASNGILFIRPTFGSVLGGTDGNVSFGTLTGGDVIVYDGTGLYWKNAAQSTLSVGTATNIAAGAQGSIPYQTGAGTTSFLAKDTNATRYLANTGSSNNPAWSQIDLSNGVTGTLPIANGGTNATATPTAGTVAYGTGTAYAFTAAGTSGQVLTSAGAGTPTWTTATNLNTASAIVQRDASGNFSAGTITAALTGNASTATSLAGGVASNIPYQSGVGTTAFLANGTAGQVLLSNGAAAPSWAGIDGGTF